MIDFFLILSVGMCVMVLLCLYRATYGPDVLNRAAGLSAIGTKTLIILLLMGVIYDRIDMFIDISMVYALLNFIGTVVLAKYLEGTGDVSC